MIDQRPAAFTVALIVVNCCTPEFNLYNSAQSSILKSLIYNLNILSAKKHTYALYNSNQLKYSLLLQPTPSSEKKRWRKRFFFPLQTTL